MGRQKGYKHSAETRAKMSASRMGYVVPEDVRRKLSESHKGQKRTPEQKLNMTKGWRLRRAKQLGVSVRNVPPTKKERELSKKIYGADYVIDFENIPCVSTVVEKEKPVEKKVDVKSFVAKHGKINLFG